MDLPWHANQTIDEIPTYKDAPTKRVPIRGIVVIVCSYSSLIVTIPFIIIFIGLNLGRVKLNLNL